jgi:hypothetical protein
VSVNSADDIVLCGYVDGRVFIIRRDTDYSDYFQPYEIDENFCEDHSFVNFFAAFYTESHMKYTELCDFNYCLMDSDLEKEVYGENVCKRE